MNKKETKKIIKWLISNKYRGQGRSRLLAECFLEEAIENIGEKIYIFDHDNGAVNIRSLLYHITSIWDETNYKNLNLTFNSREKYILIYKNEN